MEHELRVPHVVNEDALDIVRAMLDRDVEARVDIKEVVAHPWVAGVV
jgi:protein-serine/threonine kinase